MTTLKSSYNVESTPTGAAINGRLYSVNDFDPMQVWDGSAATMRDAGIAGPAVAPTAPTTASGNGTVGTHLVRYRFLDSTSPGSTYRSNASPNLSQSVTVSATDGKLTFSIGSAATNIIRSTDAKADTIQVEMTLASGSDFYVAATVANTATTVDVNISDANLQILALGGLYDTNIDPSTDYGVGHDKPPLGTIVAQCKDRTFIGGTSVKARTVGITLSSTSVTGTNFSTLWSGRILRISGDTAVYPISSSTATTITLAKNYAGATNAAASATISTTNPNRIYWSAAKNGAQLPESWKITQMARDVLNGTGDQLSGFINWQGDLLIAGKYSMERLVFVDDPATGELVSVAGKFGVWNQRCFVVVDQRLFGWGPNGLWEMRAAGPTWISRPIDRTLADTSSDGCSFTAARGSQAHGVYDPTEKVIRWFFCRTGETTPREAVCLDLQGGRWVRAQWRQGIDASCTAIDSTGKYLALLSDATNGRTWYHTGATDGVPSTSTGAYTAASGSTTTVINVTGSLPTSGTGLAGAMLYVPSTGAAVPIQSNTSSAITVSTALAGAPAAGTAVYAGQIPWIMSTSWWMGEDLKDKKRAHLFLHFIPTTGGVLRVRLYQDYSASPLAWTLVDNVKPPRGVTLWANGQTYVEVSTDTADSIGVVKIPMPTDWNRVLRASVECLSPAGTLRLLNVFFGPTRQDTIEVTNE